MLGGIGVSASNPKKSTQMKILGEYSVNESWNISSSELFQFSAITPVRIDGENYVFAVVTDKANAGGIYYLSLIIDTKAMTVRGSGLHPLEGTVASDDVRDPEGIAKVGDNFWVSGEKDQKILEYDALGYPTGRVLEVPDEFSKEKIQPNLGFESLTYDSNTNTLWTTTENSLREDVLSDGDNGPMLRLQGFDAASLKPKKQLIYYMDKPKYSTVKARATYVHGVSDILSLPDGRIVVMEREVYVDVRSLKLKSIVKLYSVDPSSAKEGEALQKTLIDSLVTGLKGLKLTLANYEGMTYVNLPDYGQAIILVNDSQGKQSKSRGKISVSLSDYIRVVPL